MFIGFLRFDSAKTMQEESLPTDMHYIRGVVTMTDYVKHEEDGPTSDSDSDAIRVCATVVICMNQEGSLS